MSKIVKFGRIYPRLIFPKRKKSVLSSLSLQKFKCHQCLKCPHVIEAAYIYIISLENRIESKQLFRICIATDKLYILSTSHSCAKMHQDTFRSGATSNFSLQVDSTRTNYEGRGGGGGTETHLHWACFSDMAEDMV